MKASLISTLFLVGVYCSTPGDVYSDLITLDGDVNSTASMINNWDGTLPGWPPWQQRTQLVLSDIRKAINDVVASPSANQFQTNQIVNYFNSPLTPDYINMLNAHINRKQSIYNDGLVVVIRQNLRWLRGNTTELCNDLNVAYPLKPNAFATSCSKIYSAHDRADAAFPP